MTRMTRLRIVLTVAMVAVCAVLAIGTQAQTTNDHAIAKDERGRPVYTELSGTCMGTKWTENHNPCGIGVTGTTAIQKQVRHAAISQGERTVYFPFNKATLLPDAMSRLDTLVKDIKSGHDIKGARIVGFADRIGTPSYSEKLSRKRAEAVKNYLVSNGIVNASATETRWFGASMPATNCPDNLPRSELIACLQTDRYVEVEIDYASEVVASK